MKTNTDYINDVKKLLPKEIWEEAQNEVLENNNQGVWTMYLVAIEKLSNAYYELKEENKEYEQKYIATLVELAKQEIDPRAKEYYD